MPSGLRAVPALAVLVLATACRGEGSVTLCQVRSELEPFLDAEAAEPESWTADDFDRLAESARSVTESELTDELAQVADLAATLAAAARLTPDDPEAVTPVGAAVEAASARADELAAVAGSVRDALDECPSG